LRLPPVHQGLQDEPDREGLMQFAGLLVALAAISALSAGPAAIR